MYEAPWNEFKKLVSFLEERGISVEDMGSTKNDKFCKFYNQKGESFFSHVIEEDAVSISGDIHFEWWRITTEEKSDFIDKVKYKFTEFENRGRTVKVSRPFMGFEDIFEIESSVGHYGKLKFGEYIVSKKNTLEAISRRFSRLMHEAFGNTITDAVYSKTYDQLEDLYIRNHKDDLIKDIIEEHEYESMASNW